MATYDLPLTGGIHKQIEGGTTDTINVPTGRTPKVVRMIGSAPLFARGDSTAAVADADGTYLVTADPVDIVVQPGAHISITPGSDANSWYSAHIVSG